MQKLLFTLTILTLALSSFISFSFVTPTETATVTWYTWEEAVELQKKTPKKLFIDVYTDWCGWCKKMDKSTFQHPEVAKYLNENFYPIKLDAEMRKDVVFNGHTFKYVANGRRGYHELAASLLNNRMSYPSCVAMDENINRITIIPGYRDNADMLSILNYIGKEKYKTMTYDEYLKEGK